MADNDERRESGNSQLFASLVMMFTTSAMQQLGKLINPLTGKTDVNLEAAQLTIDLLIMLREKTSGNLTKEEQKLLNDAISTLQLNYVETAQGGSASASESSKTEQTSSGSNVSTEQEKQQEPPPAAEQPFEEKQPKFRKSYGP